MIYVLSGDRRDTQAWASSEGLKFVEVKHVQNTGSLPGVLHPAKHRIVKLPSYANRRDHWAIDAKLRQITRRGNLQIEEIDFDRHAPAVDELPLEDIYKAAVFLEAEEDFSAGEDEPIPDAPETPDVAASDQEPAEQIEEKAEEKAEVAGPPADDKEKYPGVLEIGGALPVSPKFDPTPTQIDSLESAQKLSDDELREIGASDEDIAVLKPVRVVPADESLQDTKPADPPAEKKTRRKKEQVAYDNALLAYSQLGDESAWSELEVATEALKKRFPDDDRLQPVARPLPPAPAEDLDF